MHPALRFVRPATPLAVAALALATPLRAQPAPRADPIARPMEPVARAPVGPIAGTRPTYPPMLRSAGWEGTVVIALTVDSTGAAVPGSVRVLERTHELFAAATQKVIASWRFEPATAVDSAAGRPRMRPRAAPTQLTISYRLVPDSAALASCLAVAPVTRVCAPQEQLVRQWLHE